MKNPFKKGAKTMTETKETKTEEAATVDTTKTDALQNGGKVAVTFEEKVIALEARVENLVKRNHLLEADR